MNNRQLAGLIALILVVAGLGALVYYTYGLGPAGTDIAGAVADKPAAEPPAPPAEEPAASPPRVSAASTAVPEDTPPAAKPRKDESRLGQAPGSSAASAPETAAAPPQPSAGADTPATADRNADPAPAPPDPPAPETETAMVAPGEPAAPPASPQLEMNVTGDRPALNAPPSAVPTFDVVRVEPTGEAALAGLSAPGAKVELMDGQQVIATAEANARGEWTMILEQPLKPGTHDLALRATSPDGSAQFLSEQRVAVAIPDTGSRDVLAVVNEPGAPSRVLTKPEEGASVAAAEPAPLAERFINAEPSAPPAAEPSVTVDAVEADPDGGLYIAGTAKTPDPVRIYLNDGLLGETRPGPEGKWLHEGVRKLEPGSYRVRADQVSPKTGEVIVRAEVSFEREPDVAILTPKAEAGSVAGAAASGGVPTPATVIIRRGDNLWTISRRWYGRGIRYSAIYEANADQIRDPHWIYPGQVFVMPEGSAAWQD